MLSYDTKVVAVAVAILGRRIVGRLIAVTVGAVNTEHLVSPCRIRPPGVTAIIRRGGEDENVGLNGLRELGFDVGYAFNETK